MPRSLSLVISGVKSQAKVNEQESNVAVVLVQMVESRVQCRRDGVVCTAVLTIGKLVVVKCRGDAQP